MAVLVRDRESVKFVFEYFFGISCGQIGSRARFVSFVEDFKKMLEGEQETDSGEQVNTEPCGVTLEDLKKQKRINKMQLTKLYSRLVRPMAKESVNIDAILATLEDTEEKMLDVIQLLEDLVVTYKKNGDKQNLARTEEEIDKVAKDTDKEISRVKGFLASRTKKIRNRPKSILKMKRLQNQRKRTSYRLVARTEIWRGSDSQNLTEIKLNLNIFGDFRKHRR